MIYIRYLIGEEVKAECLSEVSKPQSTIEVEYTICIARFYEKIVNHRVL